MLPSKLLWFSWEVESGPETVIILAEKKNIFDHTHFQVFWVAELSSHIDIMTSNWERELLQKSFGNTVRNLKV